MKGKRVSKEQSKHEDPEQRMVVGGVETKPLLGTKLMYGVATMKRTKRGA